MGGVEEQTLIFCNEDITQYKQAKHCRESANRENRDAEETDRNPGQDGEGQRKKTMKQRGTESRK